MVDMKVRGYKILIAFNNNSDTKGETPTLREVLVWSYYPDNTDTYSPKRYNVTKTFNVKKTIPNYYQNLTVRDFVVKCGGAGFARDYVGQGGAIAALYIPNISNYDSTTGNVTISNTIADVWNAPGLVLCYNIFVYALVP